MSLRFLSYNLVLYRQHEILYCIIEPLNTRKTFVNYAPDDVGNTYDEIKNLYLNNKHLTMSASEMITFPNYFTLMVGDMVPNDDEVWQFLLKGRSPTGRVGPHLNFCNIIKYLKRFIICICFKKEFYVSAYHNDIFLYVILNTVKKMPYTYSVSN